MRAQPGRRGRRAAPASGTPALATVHPFLLLLLVAAGLMQLPALHALSDGAHALARSFFYHGLLTAGLAVTVILAVFGRPASTLSQNRLLSLFLTFFGLPVFLALPLAATVPTLTFAQCYFEMLSSLTTTGATLFDRPGEVAETLHLWRGLCGWLGGFVFLVAALAVLEPLKIGGFEIEAALGGGQSSARRKARGAVQANLRVLRFARVIFLPYALLTGLLLLGLVLAGDRPVVAAIHAMSVLATSGISPLETPSVGGSGRVGEALVFVFLFAAVTQKTLRVFWNRDMTLRRGADPEVKIALALTGGITLVLFLRHYSGAIDVAAQADLRSGLAAVWGSAFTVLSFLTTLGFESHDWEESRAWSGLSTPGMILLALSLTGGGVATTAGGVKLLRVYALYKHGAREMGRLVHPNSVGGAGMTARRIRREGATVAWVFLMLFILCIAGTLLALTLAGIEFEAALALSVAALTNTGPAAFVLDTDIRLVELDVAATLVLAVAMVFGRLEALVIIALFNPAYWRS